MLFIYLFVAHETPSFSKFNVSTRIMSMENENIFVNYSVSGLPYPDIKWFKSINGLPLKEIAKCPGHAKQCKMSSLSRKISITKHSFSISNLDYAADDNVTYTCKATSKVGMANKSFTIRIYSKCKINLYFTVRYCIRIGYYAR